MTSPVLLTRSKLLIRIKATWHGRIVFGASAMLYGAIALMCHDAHTWQGLRQIWSLRFGAIIGGGLMTAQIAGGIAMQHPRTARLASIVLGVVYLLFALACTRYFSADYGNFFEQLSLLCGAIAVYAATETNQSRAVLFGQVARIGLGACAILFALNQIRYLSFTARMVPGWIPPNQMFWAILTTIAFALAAIAILINRRHCLRCAR